MPTLVFATANPHKVREIQAQLGDAYTFRSLLDIGCAEEVPETSDTLAGNALQKARYVAERYGVDCFAEDTGLEVDALDGAPGVRTARYAGLERSDAANIAKVLTGLAGHVDRAARFRTVIALVRAGREDVTFEGVCRGRIADEARGNGGFGYDPIFMPEGYAETFAELPLSVKKAVSHRALAMGKLVDFLSAKR